MSRPTASAWERLSAIATLGTQRAPLPDALWPDPSLAAAGDNVERSLLRAAGATLLWRLAGQRATVQPPPTSDAMPSSGAGEVSEAAAWRLGRMLSDEDPDLIREWLSLAQSAGKQLPPHWLPAVLDGLATPLLREFAAVLGPAAAWLASRNRRWRLPGSPQPAPDPGAEERWLYGTLSERRFELQALRARDPARARGWLEGTWRDDPPEAREAFLNVLLEGLSGEDEAFLEAALDDKRKAVRLGAAECLARLPQSAYVARCCARVDPLLALERNPVRLRLQLPAALDKAAQRDGLELKPPTQRKIGERAFWLSQLVARVPPGHFSARFACDPAAFVGAALENEFAAELLPALSAATLRNPELAWIAALCAACRRIAQPAELRAGAIAELIAVAPPGARPGLIEQGVRGFFAETFDSGFALLSRVEEPWTTVTSQIALRALAGRARSDLQHPARSRNTLERWARCCELTTAQPIAHKLLEICPADSAWLRALENFVEIIEYRVAMRQELLDVG